jgi:Ni,Fe-hydrogenase III small subunit
MPEQNKPPQMSRHWKSLGGCLWTSVVVAVKSEVVSGTDVIIFKILSPKNSVKKLAFLTQNKAKICKILIITLVFEKNANFFSENWRKSQKIVIITSIPG